MEDAAKKPKDFALELVASYFIFVKYIILCGYHVTPVVYVDTRSRIILIICGFACM